MVAKDIEMGKLCSIIMPVYNAEKYLAQAIDSVIAQSYSHWELLLINDGSVDGSLGICRTYASQDHRIRVIDLGTNKGCAFARNVGLQEAKGEYIAFLDSDDLWFPEKLALQVADLQEDDLSFTAYNMVDAELNIIKSRPASARLDFEDLLCENSIIFSTVLLKADKVKQLKFDGNCYHEDYWFLLNLLQLGCKFKGLNQVLLNYRIHPASRSFSKLNAAKERWTVYRNFLKFGFLKSTYYFILYAINGVRKYL